MLTKYMSNKNEMEILDKKYVSFGENKNKLDERCHEGKWIGFYTIIPAYIPDEDVVHRGRCVEIDCRSSFSHMIN